MYARVAAFERSDPSLLDELIGRIRERSDAWRSELPDARGSLMLVDREGKRGLGITFFESEDDIRKAEPIFDRMGDEIPEEVRGRRVSVETYEVAVQEGGEGAQAARVSTLEGPAERLDEATRQAQDSILPRARQVSGWKGIVSLVDRRTGRTKLITLWDSADSMRASEEQADRLRQESAEGSGSRIVGVERYEVAYAERLAEVETRR
jgi:hypothetical protein